jgi:hypothetical protein
MEKWEFILLDKKGQSHQPGFEATWNDIRGKGDYLPGTFFYLDASHLNKIQKLRHGEFFKIELNKHQISNMNLDWRDGWKWIKITRLNDDFGGVF